MNSDWLSINSSYYIDFSTAESIDTFFGLKILFFIIYLIIYLCEWSNNKYALLYDLLEFREKFWVFSSAKPKIFLRFLDCIILNPQ